MLFYTQEASGEDTVITILTMRKLRLRESGRPLSERKLSKNHRTVIIKALNPGICDSKIHGEIRDLEAERCQPTSHPLLLITRLGHF